MKQEDIIKEVAGNIQKQKDDLILQRINERSGLVIPFNIEEEKHRRFPRIKCDDMPGVHEAWYWNDGSINGIHLITFYYEPLNMELDGSKRSFTVNLSYK